MQFLAFILLCVSPISLAESVNSYYQKGAAPKYYKEGEVFKGIGVEYIQHINDILEAKNVNINISGVANFSRIKHDLEKGKIGVFFGNKNQKT